MNSTTGNGSIESSSCFSSTTAYKIGGTVTLSLILAVSLMANSFIVLIVYKTQTLRKPISYFIANMAMSDLLYSIFQIPFRLSMLHTTSWLIGGKFGQALCKLVPFFRFHYRFNSESDSDSSESIWSRGISTPFPTY